MEMIAVKTAELAGAALDWAVAQAIGADQVEFGVVGSAAFIACIHRGTWERNWRPSTDWSQGGPLIEKHLVSFCVEHEDVILAVLCDDYGMYISGWRQGETHLIAACRAIVAAKMGDTVQVPAQLVESKT